MTIAQVMFSTDATFFQNVYLWLVESTCAKSSDAMAIIYLFSYVFVRHNIAKIVLIFVPNNNSF